MAVTTVAARISPGVKTSAPGSPLNGQSWFNSTTGLTQTQSNGIGVNSVPLVQVIGPTAVGGSTTPVTMVDSAFPAGFLNIVGRFVESRIIFSGNSAGANATYTFTIKLGTSTLYTLTTGSVLLGTRIAVDITISLVTLTTGVSGIVVAIASGIGSLVSGNTQVAGSAAPTLTETGPSFDLTSALDLTFIVSSSVINATNTMGFYYAKQSLLQ